MASSCRWMAGGWPRAGNSTDVRLAGRARYFRRVRPLPPAPLLLCLACGCDPRLTLRGHVTDAAGAPIAGAEIASLSYCVPSPQPMVTDDTGRFFFSQLGLIDSGCVLEVRKAGYRPLRVTVTFWSCKDWIWWARRCALFELDARLEKN